MTGQSAYLPFRGLSAWFSSSVRPSTSKKWDKFGGSFSKEDEADYLFSDNSYSIDTVRVCDTQPGVTVFQSMWVNEVITKCCTVYDIPLGQYLVLPHYLVQVSINGDPFKTPETGTLMEINRGITEDGTIVDKSSPAVVVEEGGGSLSQLLAKREEKKMAKIRRHYERRQLRPKNSREYFTAETKNDTKNKKSSSLNDDELKEERVGGTVTDCVLVGSEEYSVHEGWAILVHCAKIATHNEVQHIDNMQIMTHKMIDFNPSLPHFIMKRK